MIIWTQVRQTGLNLRRYQEKSYLSATPGTIQDLGDTGKISNGTNEGLLDVDMAELSLGQRLTVGATAPAAGSGDKLKDSANSGNGVSVSSLTRTLTQALHSSDSRLLELCLAHSDPKTIQITVEKLAPQFALPLLSMCVERLGRGHRGANLKGGGGGASSQRGSSLIAWVRAVLIIHGGHLMAVIVFNYAAFSLAEKSVRCPIWLYDCRVYILC